MFAARNRQSPGGAETSEFDAHEDWQCSKESRAPLAAAVKDGIDKEVKKRHDSCNKKRVFQALFDWLEPSRFPVRNQSPTSDKLYVLSPSVHNPRSTTSLRTSCLQVANLDIYFKFNNLTAFIAAYHTHYYDYLLLFYKDS